MMLLAGSLLLGGLGGMTIPYLEHQLINEFEEIKEEKKWRPWLLPLMNSFLCFMAVRGNPSYLAALINIVLISLLVLLTCFDIKYMLLPTKVILPGIVLVLCRQIVEWLLSKETGILLNSLLGGLAGFGVFWLIFYGSRLILKKDGLGFGDVRLMALIGLIVGLDKVFLVMIIASVLAAIAGVIQLMIRKQSEAFPFGPYLCLGTILMMIWGEQIMTLYLQCLGL